MLIFRDYEESQILWFDQNLKSTDISRVLKHAGADKEYIDEYLKEAASGDYNHLLTISMKYVNIE